MYYQNKVESIKSLFGAKSVIVKDGFIQIDNKLYRVVNDVIILTDTETEATGIFAPDIQFTFGEEWKTYDKVLDEHEAEFNQYFDIVDIKSLKEKRVCDLGCGNGRWSYFLKDKCRELVLVDFSEAIFVARKNLKENDNCLFFRCDIKKLPFKDNAFDFLFCLGVLHHLPTSCLDETRALKKFSGHLLIFLYYALDNRPVYFRVILGLVTFIRKAVSKIKSELFRKIFSVFGTIFVYVPLINIGHVLKVFNLSRYVPLFEFYQGKTLARIEQDVYDRFFTRIEQRVSRKDIMTLKDTFSEVTISDNLPYWHFVCKR